MGWPQNWLRERADDLLGRDSEADPGGFIDAYDNLLWVARLEPAVIPNWTRKEGDAAACLATQGALRDPGLCCATPSA